MKIKMAGNYLLIEVKHNKMYMLSVVFGGNNEGFVGGRDCLNLA